MIFRISVPAIVGYKDQVIEVEAVNHEKAIQQAIQWRLEQYEGWLRANVTLASQGDGDER